MTTYKEVRRYESADGKRAVALYVGEHALVRYVLLEWREPDPDSPYEAKGYWAPMRESGVYSSLQEAQRDACLESAWLNDILENTSAVSRPAG